MFGSIRSTGRSVVEGHGVVKADDTYFLTASNVLAPASVASLRAALRRLDAFTRIDQVITFRLSPLLPEDFSIDLFTPYRPVGLVWAGGELVVECQIEASPRTSEEEVERAVEAAATRLDGAAGDIEWYVTRSGSGGTFTTWLPWRGQTVGELIEVGERARAIVAAILAGDLDASNVAALIRTGAPEILLGEYEGQWLAAKSVPYRLDEVPEQLELGKDVAAMANAGGGLLVLGAVTKRRPGGGEEIVKLNGCVSGAVNQREYRHVVSQVIHPPPVGVRIDITPLRDRELILVEVPEQPADFAPFLVDGSTGGKKATGLGFTWPIRSGADTTAPAIQTIHSLRSSWRGVVARRRDG
ncbi:AlbA family DNA-binding domain-containing protein [Baekduia alba]|uniref:AlbA family DNA-binding domain-containing protein n=1 Tax=Baekduia alba TaxID=2997333 RepID=UPI002340CED6|nr:hypothetical protein [Baekduia alba]